MFQSTRPVRGATSAAYSIASTRAFQSTRPVRGATVAAEASHYQAEFQSTRPVRGATATDDKPTNKFLFQSTRPVRGATHTHGRRALRRLVSIHAPRAGRDTYARTTRPTAFGFNPRAPCGARPSVGAVTIPPFAFQSTRPVRGATNYSTREEGAPQCFNPRAPCGARPIIAHVRKERHNVSIHAPRAGRDLYNHVKRM